MEDDTMEDDYAIYRTICNQYLGPIVSIIGIIGNLLCLAAICYRNFKISQNSSSSSSGSANFVPSRGMNNHMYIFIRGLALADLAYLAFSLLSFYFGSSLKIYNDNRDFVVNFEQPAWNSLKATSDIIVIFMTVDRCRMMGDIAQIRLQTLRSENDRPWPVYCQLLGAFVFSLVMHLPYFFGIFTREPVHHQNDTMKSLPETDSVSRGKVSFQELRLIYEVIYVVVFKVLPVLIVVVLNIILIKRLRVVWERRKKLTQV